MFVRNGGVPLILMLAGVGLTLARPNSASDNPPVSVQDPTTNDAAQSRFLEPAYFGVRKKTFSIGTSGVGSFFRAWRNCIDEGKSLATVESEEELRALEQLLANKNPEYWIAATNLGSAQKSKLTWITSDLRVQVRPHDFTPTLDTCVSVNKRGRWRNNDCLDDGLQFPYVCEAYF